MKLTIALRQGATIFKQRGSTSSWESQGRLGNPGDTSFAAYVNITILIVVSSGSDRRSYISDVNISKASNHRIRGKLLLLPFLGKFQQISM